MSEQTLAEKSFFEYVDLALEDHENFQLSLEDARTAFNEQFEDYEPYDIADHAHYSAYKELELKLAESEKERDKWAEDWLAENKKLAIAVEALELWDETGDIERIESEQREALKKIKG